MTKRNGRQPQSSPTPEELAGIRNRPLRIPLPFDKALEGLLNTKPKKKPAPKK